MLHLAVEAAGAAFLLSVSRSVTIEHFQKIIQLRLQRRFPNKSILQCTISPSQRPDKQVGDLYRDGDVVKISITFQDVASMSGLPFFGLPEDATLLFLSFLRVLDVCRWCMCCRGATAMLNTALRSLQRDRGWVSLRLFPYEPLGYALAVMESADPRPPPLCRILYHSGQGVDLSYTLHLCEPLPDFLGERDESGGDMTSCLFPNCWSCIILKGDDHLRLFFAELPHTVSALHSAALSRMSCPSDCRDVAVPSEARIVSGPDPVTAIVMRLERWSSVLGDPTLPIQAARALCEGFLSCGAAAAAFALLRQMCGVPVPTAVGQVISAGTPAQVVTVGSGGAGGPGSGLDAAGSGPKASVTYAPDPSWLKLHPLAVYHTLCFLDNMLTSSPSPSLVRQYMRSGGVCALLPIALGSHGVFEQSLALQMLAAMAEHAQVASLLAADRRTVPGLLSVSVLCVDSCVRSALVRPGRLSRHTAQALAWSARSGRGLSQMRTGATGPEGTGYSGTSRRSPFVRDAVVHACSCIRLHSVSIVSRVLPFCSDLKPFCLPTDASTSPLLDVLALTLTTHDTLLRSAGLSLVSAFVSSPLGSVMFVSMGAHRWLFPLLCLPTPECKAALLPILTALLSCEGEMGDGSERENFSHFLLEAGLGRALLPWLATPEHAREGKALMKIALGRVVTDTTETVFLRGALEAVSAAETATSALSAEEIEDRARRAQALRKSGNSEFEAGNHAVALTLYWQSLSLLPLHTAGSDCDISPLLLRDRVSLCGNIAECYLAVSSFPDAARAATSALMLDPGDHKSRMRRIRAVVGLGRAGSAPWASAFEDIVKRHSQLVSKFRRGSEAGSDVDDGEEDSPDDLSDNHLLSGTPVDAWLAVLLSDVTSLLEGGTGSAAMRGIASTILMKYHEEMNDLVCSFRSRIAPHLRRRVQRQLGCSLENFQAELDLLQSKRREDNMSVQALTNCFTDCVLLADDTPHPVYDAFMAESDTSESEGDDGWNVARGMQPGWESDC